MSRKKGHTEDTEMTHFHTEKYFTSHNGTTS